MTSNEVCDCEHDSHFSSPEAHKYRLPFKHLYFINTEYGLYSVCRECLFTCWRVKDVPPHPRSLPKTYTDPIYRYTLSPCGVKLRIPRTKYARADASHVRRLFREHLEKCLLCTGYTSEHSAYVPGLKKEDSPCPE